MCDVLPTYDPYMGCDVVVWEDMDVTHMCDDWEVTNGKCDVLLTYRRVQLLSTCVMCYQRMRENKRVILKLVSESGNGWLLDEDARFTMNF